MWTCIADDASLHTWIISIAIPAANLAITGIVLFNRHILVQVQSNNSRRVDVAVGNSINGMTVGVMSAANGLVASWGSLASN